MLPFLLAAALLLQDNPPKPPPLPGARESTPATPHAPETKLVPGVLPESTGAEERVLWQALCAAALAKGATRTPLTAFDLWLDVTINSSSNQTNEATTLRYRYQAPDRLRAMTEHGYELVRGPKGDLLIDPKRNLKEALAVGREGDEDRRTLEEILDLARNFVALSDPAALRIAEMKLGRVEAALLPEELRASAVELKWLELRSPDFRLPRGSAQTASAPGGLVRVRLGLRKDKPLPELCIVSGEQPGAQLSTLIRVPEYREKQGLLVPWQLRIHGLDESGSRFEAKPALLIWLKKDSDLHPSFAPEIFAP